MALKPRVRPYVGVGRISTNEARKRTKNGIADKGGAKGGLSGVAQGVRGPLQNRIQRRSIVGPAAKWTVKSCC